MGMYTGVRFKGYVKKEFRENFEGIALNGEWLESEVEEFRLFGETFGRAGFIPCGSLSYMPEEWESFTENFRKYSDLWWASVSATDGFERTYNKETGYWTFQCSLKNYGDEIENWFRLIPLFIDKIVHLEYYYEEWDSSKEYKLIDGVVKCVNNEFIKYVSEDQ